MKELFKRPAPTHTRRISPYLGLLGILGILGFLGFLPKLLHVTDLITVPFPFLFFAFFGFFSFFYEGKMSGTLIDERYLSNAYRASSIANRIALLTIILSAIFSVSILKIRDPYTLVSFLFSVIGFSFGLSIFLSAYLLYRFENEE